MRAIIYRFGAVASALMLFLYMSYLYDHGDINLYKAILTLYGVSPFRFPFLDISGSLAAWECTRQGVDVILSDPCDVLQRGYTYSPLWMAASAVPLGVGDTTAVGWILALLFLASLSLLPPPRCPVELVLVLAATLSTTVVFAVERANPDIMLFVLALTTGLLAAGGPTARLVGYAIALLSALVKYYPITVLVIAFRERISIFVAVGLIVLCSLALFWAEYHVELAKGIPHTATGAYSTGFFAGKNLPFLLGETVGNALEPSSLAPLAARIVSVGLYLTSSAAALPSAGAHAGICEPRSLGSPLSSGCAL